MPSHVRQWGNSLGLRIPKSVAQQLEIRAGDAIELKIVDDELLIKKKKPALVDLLKEVTTENCHAAIELASEPLGKEIW